MWDIQLGKEIPIIGYAKSFQEDPYPAPGKWGMGLWIPVSFHTTLDHKDPSSPIINTDYRFKFTGKAMYGSKDAADTYWGAMLTIWAHESTHLGDEFSLAAQFNSPDEFRRVNVSWEFWEFGASYFKIRQNSDELTFRVGTRGLWTVKPFALRGDNSFYSVDPREANFRQVTLSKRSIESFYGQFQYVFVNDGKRWFPFVSIDARMRVIYDYDRPSANAKEDYGFGLNMLLGLITNRDISERGRVDPYFRFYYGVNPNGQFRNQSDFWLVGLGLGVDL